MLADLYVRNGHVVTEQGVFQGGVVVKAGKIAQLVQGDADIAAETTIDLAGRYLLPGLIDAHVHFSEPGRGHWEGFRTGTMAAAAGGITTVIEMPLNATPPTIDAENLRAKQAIAAQEALVDYALWGGLVTNNLDKLDELHRGGVVALKAFLTSTGSDFIRIDDDLLYAGLLQARALGTLVGVHAENEWVTRYLMEKLQAAGRKDTAAWGEARPPATELEAIQRVLFWAKETGGQLHIVHVSLADGIQAVALAKQAGVKVTVETCPHYLLFDEDDFARIGPMAKCAPPLRARDEVEALWQRVLQGQVDVIASDHSPCLLEEKERGNDDVWLAWGGISGIQTLLPALLTEGVQRRGLSLPALVRMTAANPARIFGLYPHKGTLLPGADADLVILDPHKTWVLTQDNLFYKNPHSAFVGYEFTGRVEQTIVRGVTVFRDGEIQVQPGFGQLQLRSA
ncbi:allantoinase [soil metagenome]